MNSEDKFKNLLKEKLGSQEFPFNPENWDEARGMIDDARSKKRKIMPLVFFGAGIFILGILSGIFIFYSGSQTQIASSGNTSESFTNEKTSTNPDAENKTKTRDNNRVTQNSKKSIPGEQPANQTIANNIDDTQAAEKSVPSVAAQYNKMNEAQKSQGMRVEMQLVDKTKKQQHVNISEARLSVDMKRKKNNAAVAQPVQNKIRPVTLDVTKAGVDKTDVKSSKSDIAVVASENINATASDNADTKNNTDAEVKMTAETLANTGVLQTSSVAVNETKKSPEEIIPATAVADVKDSLTEPKNIFSVEGGVSYLSGWQGSQVKDADGVNPIVGINYLRVVSKNIYVSFGIHYTTVGNLSNYSHESVSGRYSFGRDGIFTVITPVKIQYLLAPVKVAYVFNSKNMLGAGYTLGYLLSVNSKVQTYTQKYNSTSDAKITMERGYSQGFNTFDSQFSLFYRRVLYADLSANVECFYGVSDIKKNSFYQQNIFERNMGMKLTLIYNIFKR